MAEVWVHHQVEVGLGVCSTVNASLPCLLLTGGTKPVSLRSEGPDWVYILQTYQKHILAFGCFVIYKLAEAL